MIKQASGILLGLSLVLSLTGCAPPPKKGEALSSEGGGHTIIHVNPKPRGDFKTVDINGVEYREARGPVGKPGGTFYDAELGTEPKTFNPWASSDATSGSMGGMMISSLVDTDAYTGKVIPYLAKEVTVQPDHLTYTVKLRKGLKWSDGQPLTADDVVFTWNEIVGKGLGNPSTRDGLMVDGRFPTAKQLDALTVEFKTAKPFAPFLRQLGVGIAPKHIFAPIIAQGGDKTFSAAWGTSDAASHPEKFVSSGLWILEKYIPGEKVIFKRNPNFFMVDSQGTHLPYLDRYVISFVKDMNNQELQFEQGKLDKYNVPGKFVAMIRKLERPAFNLYNIGPNSGTTFLTFNMNTRKDPETGKPYVDPVKSRWFTNLKFRQAVDWTINREDIVKNILKGVGQPLFTAEGLPSIYLNKDLAKGHPQDVEKAKALLREGGFSWNQSGQLVDNKGNRVEFTLYTNTGNEERESTGVNIKQDLGKLGMQVNFKPLDFNVLVSKTNTGEWEAIIIGLTGSALDPHSGVNVWKSTGGLHMFNQRDVKNKNVLVPDDRFPWEKELDSLFEQGAQTFDDAQRHKIYNRYQEIAYEEQPFIYLFSGLDFIAVKKRVQNFDPTPLGAWHNMEEIWIKE